MLSRVEAADDWRSSISRTGNTERIVEAVPEAAAHALDRGASESHRRAGLGVGNVECLQLT